MDTEIAIQGIKGSFHHQVAQNYFQPNIFLKECLSFLDLVKSLKQNKSITGVMALENSIAGSIIPNYALIDQYNLQIVGEYYLDIHMNLMVLKGQKIEEITEVHSHPIALLQCAVFFNKYPHIKLVESVDTAETAQRIQQQQLKGIGALAAPIASKLYNLEIIAEGIHTVKSNKTRFVILKNEKETSVKENKNKVSIKFELEDFSGELSKVLTLMSNNNLNLTKILSVPIIETPFQYSFFVDAVFEKYEYFEKTKSELQKISKHFKILGEYLKGKQ